MARKSRAIEGLPPGVSDLIRRIGSDLRTSRLRRGISQKLLAERMFVSRQTLSRVEQGDPTVSIGIYFACIFCLNRHNEIRDMMSLKNDCYGNMLEERRKMLQRKARKIDAEPFEEPDF